MWGADHDNWSKNSIHAFRWSILQPSTDISTDTSDHASITRLSRTMTVPIDTLGHTAYCGDCHYPEEPLYSDLIRSKFLTGIKGSLELDRIQLVRRPQPGK
jgi:hypothetical protein